MMKSTLMLPALLSCLCVLGCAHEPWHAKAPSEAKCRKFVVHLALKDPREHVANEFSAGEAITLETQITNMNRSVQLLASADPCVPVRFEVVDRSNRTVWSQPASAACSRYVANAAYVPGNIRTFSAQWAQELGNGTRVPDGEYSARVTDLTECGGSLSQSVAFNIR